MVDPLKELYSDPPDPELDLEKGPQERGGKRRGKVEGREKEGEREKGREEGVRKGRDQDIPECFERVDAAVYSKRTGCFHQESMLLTVNRSVRSWLRCVCVSYSRLTITNP